MPRALGSAQPKPSGKPVSSCKPPAAVLQRQNMQALPRNLECILDMESSLTLSDNIHRLEVHNISRSEHDQQIILAEGVALQQAPQLKPTSGISAHLRTSEAVLSALPILPTSSVDPSPLVCTSRLSISVDGGVGLSLLRGQALT